MGKDSTETKLQTAKELVLEMQKRYKDLYFIVEEDVGGEQAVLVRAVKPKEGTVAMIDMEEFPADSTLNGKADIFDNLIASMLQDEDDEEEDEDEDDEDDEYDEASAAEDRVWDIVERYRSCGRDYMLRHVLLETVDKRQNAEMLRRCAHVKQLDLAGLFVFPVRVDANTAGAMQLSWEQVKALGITTDELYAAAQKNMVRYLRVRVCPLERLGHQVKQRGNWYGRGLEDADMDEDGWYAVGSHRKILSSGFLFVPEVLEALGEKLESNYYITAPNVHELMICRESEDRNSLQVYVDWLKQTRQEDKFSLPDHLYFYDRAKGLKSVNRL